MQCQVKTDGTAIQQLAVPSAGGFSLLSSLSNDSIPVNWSDYDIFYVANLLSPADLRRELRRASEVSRWHKDLVDHFYFESVPWEQAEIEASTKQYEYADALIDLFERALQYQPSVKPAVKQPRRHIDVDTVKASNDIVQVIESYSVQLRKSGHNRFSALCPFHDDRGPSFTVYADSGTWHCFGACNTGGDVITFIQKMENCDFRQAVAILGGR